MFLHDMLETLRRSFRVNSEEGEEYIYSAVQLRSVRNANGNVIEITLDQARYIDDIPSMTLEND